MVDKSLNLALEKIVNDNRSINSNKDSLKFEKIEQKIKNLIDDINKLNPSEITHLRSEMLMFTALADYADRLADQLEKGKRDLQKKETEEIKKAIMDKLGVPAEFVDQLAILTKAGPQALREGATAYRIEAEKRREKLEYKINEKERLDNEVKKLTEIKLSISKTSKENNLSMNDYILQARYQEALRERSELVLKQVLEQMEGQVGATI